MNYNKEEFIAQGIELQRRWIRDIRVRAEQEHGGKLKELSSQSKRLERVASDNSTYLDENIRAHHLWFTVARSYLGLDCVVIFNSETLL